MVLLLALMACGADAEYPTSAADSQGAPTSVPAAASQQQVIIETTQVESTVGLNAIGQAAPSEGFNAIGGSATVNDAAYDLTFFQHYGVNPFIDTEDDQLSTFAIDVDTAS